MTNVFAWADAKLGGRLARRRATRPWSGEIAHDPQARADASPRISAPLPAAVPPVAWRWITCPCTVVADLTDDTGTACGCARPNSNCLRRRAVRNIRVREDWAVRARDALSWSLRLVAPTAPRSLPGEVAVRCVAAMLAHQNPDVRIEALRFLARGSRSKEIAFRRWCADRLILPSAATSAGVRCAISGPRRSQRSRAARSRAAMGPRVRRLHAARMRELPGARQSAARRRRKTWAAASDLQRAARPRRRHVSSIEPHCVVSLLESGRG